MDPSGAGTYSITAMSPAMKTRATPVERLMVALSDKQGTLLVHLVVWLLAILSGIFLGLRFIAIWYRKLVLVLDDGLLIASWNIILFYSIMASLELALGIGGQTATTGDSGPSAVLLLDNIARTLALTALAWSKSSFACSLLGLRNAALIRWSLWAIVASVNAVVMGTVIVHWIRCKPIFKAWDTGVDGTCWSSNIHNATQIAVQAYSAFLDLGLVAVGYLLVWSKHLRRSEKVGVGILMALGALASAASIVTAVEISTLTDDNFTTANIRVLLTAAIEPNVTIIICSLPALRLLVPSYNDNPHRLGSLRKFRIIHPGGTSSSSSGGGSGSISGGAGTAPPSRSGTMATPTTSSPFEGFRPPRPARPASTRSFLTDTSSAPLKNEVGGGGTPTGNHFSNNNNNSYNNNNKGGKKSVTSSTENLLQGVDYNYAHWNAAIPPSSTANSNNGWPAPAPAPAPASALPSLAQQPINTVPNSTLTAHEYLSSPWSSQQQQQQQQQQDPPSPSDFSFTLGNTTPIGHIQRWPSNNNGNQNNYANSQIRRLASVKEESHSGASSSSAMHAPSSSWGSSVVRSSRGDSVVGGLIDTYAAGSGGGGGGVGGGIGGGGGVGGGNSGRSVAGRVRDSPTLGQQWGRGWRKDSEEGPLRGHQRTGLGVQGQRPPQAAGAVGWMQRGFGGQI